MCVAITNHAGAVRHSLYNWSNTAPEREDRRILIARSRRQKLVAAKPPSFPSLRHPQRNDADINPLHNFLSRNYCSDTITPWVLPSLWKTQLLKGIAMPMFFVFQIC
jgi:hypothetical protein